MVNPQETHCYQVIHRKDSGDEVVALIQNGEITGPEAEMIRDLLVEEGWPGNGKSPTVILWGSYLFAVQVPADKP